uniref:Uncharacterized protein n=1 Tax=Anguilla anguilla TaxID=7936 RepID=A0A0E9TRQ0_ANGAN
MHLEETRWWYFHFFSFFARMSEKCTTEGVITY